MCSLLYCFYHMYYEVLMLIINTSLIGKMLGGGRLGVKNCGRSEIGGQNVWEIGG